MKDQAGNKTAKSASNSHSKIDSQISNQDTFKRPDPWVETGRNIELGTPGKAIRAVTIGIDFGTAFTKASVGMVGKIFIVNWSGTKKGDDEFVLPGLFSVLGNSSCVLGHAPTAKSILKELKQPFLSNNPSELDIAKAAVFLSLVIRYIRAWVYQHHASLVMDKRLVWSLNLGIPSKPYENQNLQNIYKNLALIAWRLSYQSKPITLTTALHAVTDLTITQKDHLESIDIIPEFVAQIASYIRSPQRQMDLHMLMDIGAGTVDVATFNVWQRDGEDIFPIFSSMVEPLGTHFLMQKRLDLISTGKKSTNWDDFSPVLPSTAFSKQFGTRRSRIDACDDEHANQVAVVIKRVLHETRLRRYPSSRKWESGIRLFFCGGGSSCEVFSSALDRAANFSQVSILKTLLPIPMNIEAKGLLSKDYHRVAVAYGLGLYAADLGKIIPVADVPDVEPLPSTCTKQSDRDELYPK
ncbi:hypothetical protein [Methylomonas koyamae]|uniref:Uncharacterized protein n=1 Tax=Methylomonas koyamae TaxID=702114 RepID=A0AA91DBE0_9GAMM|nr:hypothetical protein [Methylomonas koyamae]OAI23938.1 hypothetical protein A1356_16935 [Methylomonas koyamae]